MAPFARMILPLLVLAAPGLAIAQKPFRIDPKTVGWNTTYDGQGWYMTCLTPKCGGSSASISFSPEKSGTCFGPEIFANYVDRLAAHPARRAYRTAKLSSADLSSGATRHYKIVTTLTAKGKTEYMIEGYRCETGGAYTLESSSPDRAMAERNYEILWHFTND